MPTFSLRHSLFAIFFYRGRSKIGDEGTARVILEAHYSPGTNSVGDKQLNDLT